MTYHLAIDIGASSGRHIIGWLENGTMHLEEVYRFEDYLRAEDGSLVWDLDKLVREVKAGVARCSDIGKIPATIAIDTWGVDYVLLDENGKELLPAYAYRDSRTNAVQDEVAAILPQRELYARTGIQKANFNTLYQLYCDKKSGKLAQAHTFLMMPDYLAFRLTGEIRNEYTEATTTNLVNAERKTWDTAILEKLGILETLFQPLSLPGTAVGALKGFPFEAEVVLAPSHDTASAVAACPIGDKGVYISSGTWSLIGTENAAPVLTEEALAANFTNEGGIDYRYRFLKNFMGMWLFQCIRRDLKKQYTYDEMMTMAKACGTYEEIDTNAPAFVAPDNMIAAIRQYLHNDALTVDTVINSVYHSLAKAYAGVVKEIEAIGGKTIDTINIVGGGSKDAYLNQLTAAYTGKTVLAGPVEATATGNLLSQMLAAGELSSLEEGRALVRKSFAIREVQ